jgi:dUTP pyrophosphatase
MCNCQRNTAAIKFYCDDRNMPQLERGSDLAGGFDVRCSEHTVVIPSREAVLVGTGLHIAIPQGYVGFLKSRSGLASKKWLEVGAGVIDADYRGEVKVLLHNHSDEDVVFNYGDRIAQLVIIKISEADVEPVMSLEELGDTSRGKDGFGSTGLQ